MCCARELPAFQRCLQCLLVLGLSVCTMPVPVSVTHVSGVGLQAQGAAELPTAGPFARLAAGTGGISTANGDASANGGHSALPVQPPAVAAIAPDSHSAETRSAADDTTAAVETSSLHFTYPGIGALSASFAEASRNRVSLIVRIPAELHSTRLCAGLKSHGLRNVQTRDVAELVARPLLLSTGPL